MGVFNKLHVVVWKNCIIRKRHWLLTIFEALLPIVLFFLIAYGRSKISGLSKTEVTEPTHNYVQDISTGIDVGSTYLFYTPENKFTASVMSRVLDKFQMPSDKVFGFYNEEKMLQHYHNHHNYTVIAIVFSGNNPKSFAYTIRYHGQGTYYDRDISTNHKYSSSFDHFIPGQENAYMEKGLIYVQKTLDLSFIEYTLNSSNIGQVSIAVQEFPYPPYVVDTAITSLFLEYLPLITLFSFIFLCPAVLKRVVEEKHSGIKELLKMVGMESWMLWLGWFIYGIVPIVFSVIIIVISMKVPMFGSEYPPIEHSHFMLLFFFLLFYCMASITFCFAISSFFSKPTTAMVTGILVWILSYCIPKYSLGLQESNQLSWFVNILLNLLPNMALHFGYSAISVYEERGVGIQWNNFYQSSSGGADDVTMLNVFLMLWLDMLLFSLFTFYMDGINPGKYGVRKSLLFPIKNLMKCFGNPKSSRNVGVNFETVRLENIEEGRGLDKGIEIQNLYKRYGSKMAVNNLNLDIYKNQITVLLGHNGAGKSTTMSMITGMVEMTSGSIKINGCNIKSNMDDVRQHLGLCPQHNLLFTDLTVKEHLLFFAKLKGKSSREAEIETTKLLENLNLYEKRNELAHTLSGGMKRKLCLGMSLVGGSNVLILDEPSSGMDPESRRQLWDLLLTWRGEKTILITTHFMEEADALGDWIAIMAEGALQCYGTPMYLKKQYDTGYHLSLVVKGGMTEEEVKLIRNQVTRYISGSQLKSQDGQNLVFVLPFESNTELSSLLEALETKKEQLGIENISVTVTTLEDVFLKARVQSRDEKDKCSDESDQAGNSLLDKKSNAKGDTVTKRRTEMTIKALLHKRYLYLVTKKWMYLIPLLIALLFFCLTVYLTSQGNDSFSDEGPLLAFRLKTYRETSVYYSGKPSNDGQEVLEKLRTYYKQTVEADGSNPLFVPDVSQAIIHRGQENIAYYKEHMVAAAEFSVKNSGLEVVALYNAVALHSLPISLNLVTNALAKTLLGNEYSISTSYWPLESVNAVKSPVEYSETTVAVLWLIMIPIGCLFIIGSFIMFPHTEISTRFIQLQYMCGVKPFVYWLTNFVADLFVYFLMILPLALIVCIASPPFRHAYEFGVLLAILVAYGACGIPFSYLFARKQSASGAFALLIIAGIFLGIIMALVIGVLLESQSEYYMGVGRNVKYVFGLFVPQVALTGSVLDYSRRVVDVYNLQTGPKRRVRCGLDDHACCDDTSEKCLDYKNYMILLRENFCLMIGGCVIFLLLNILLDSHLFKRALSFIRQCLPWNYRQQNKGESRQNLVPTEKTGGNNDTLKANSLSKTYSGKQIVKNINFSLKDKECLGILGVNGAGKTTTFRMLTREEIVDEGDIHLMCDTKKINVNENGYLEKLGYCPQADTLNFSLTGRDILTVIAQLRGIENYEEEVKMFLEYFDLGKYADQPCGHYSGGNKRKLSLAVSIIGFRKIVLLDEPTNGVDPSSRRKCWKLIKSVQEQKGLSFILTSHSMAECEALCNNLMIMKDGKFVEHGTLSELKQNFGGFTLKLKLRKDIGKGEDDVDGAETSSEDPMSFRTVEDIKDYFTKDSRGELKDEHSGLLHFYIKGTDQRWSAIFKEVERIRSRNPHLIEDYNISEASLEDVFLKVARSEGEENNSD